MPVAFREKMKGVVMDDAVRSLIEEMLYHFADIETELESLRNIIESQQRVIDSRLKLLYSQQNIIDTQQRIIDSMKYHMNINGIY
jgi:hypothetical protein